MMKIGMEELKTGKNSKSLICSRKEDINRSMRGWGICVRNISDILKEFDWSEWNKKKNLYSLLNKWN